MGGKGSGNRADGRMEQGITAEISLCKERKTFFGDRIFYENGEFWVKVQETTIVTVGQRSRYTCLGYMLESRVMW